MRFCTKCGKTISILNDSDAELCQKCRPKPAKDPSQQKTAEIDLSTAHLTLKNGKFILESEEGWLLWSGEASQKHCLQAITERATKILNIRKRQQK